MIGIFEMCEEGLKEIQHPSDLFVEGRSLDSPGSVVSAVCEGSRIILVEIQADHTAAFGSGFYVQSLDVVLKIFDGYLSS